jgi:chromatin remodeling complex protein RSC6
MVRQSKSSATTTAKSAVAAPVLAPVLETATPVVAEKKAKKPKKVSEPVVVAAETVSAPVENVVLESTSDVVTDVAVESSLQSKMNEFNARLQQVLGLVSSLKAEFKTIERGASKELKAAQKASAKKTKRSGNRAPSGFVKPTKISEELALFLGKPIGTEIARTSVSKEINQYIRTNSLQDVANGRKINPDSKLTTLLKLNEGDELTYFNLQRYMKHHFIKAVVAETTETVSATATA